jgi:hypothetical protein
MLSSIELGRENQGKPEGKEAARKTKTYVGAYY